ncbi:DUF2267 domain-containing protein [Micromonospora sp. 4G57]|uniref:DUF2267 domain-containing protein n=1 Tax=Micromonospora sicca TaxID=2202420 RepID=A0ABU5J674_9ACTN|nr:MULTISPECIES: DUF2267 domain-containing protein [unclassified Micromonospora]MDZ5443430.1 DUF2267 domain-containing protein [Micromonospora sp. 4G57]MDZ5488070.1 DUF2267 domain-containing protein [Micromonospora sp. 4G53]
MNHAEFLAAVGKRAGMPAAEAETVIRATLTTLRERISGGEARDLATQLPEEFRGYLHKEVDFAEQLDLVEFLNEVRARTGMDAQRAADGARAVLTTLREAVSAQEVEDLEAELPTVIRQLLYPVGRGVGA